MTQQKKDDSLNEVLGQVAYQMKETMTVMYAMLQRIAPPESRDADGALDESAATLTHSFFRLRRLAGNLEEAANLDAPALPISSNDDIVGLCRTMVDRVSHSAEMLGISLEFRCERASHIIRMDADRIERLMLNLLSNALKFTGRGGSVVVEVRVNPGQVEIRVSDTGCGIRPEYMDDLFVRYRSMNLPDGSPRGLGLGLPISRRIAEDHGGSLVVFSKVGEGTTVIASLENKKTSSVGMTSFIAGDYAGGFNRTLLELSDALPKEAFMSKMID